MVETLQVILIGHSDPSKSALGGLVAGEESLEIFPPAKAGLGIRFGSHSLRSWAKANLSTARIVLTRFFGYNNFIVLSGFSFCLSGLSIPSNVMEMHISSWAGYGFVKACLEQVEGSEKKP